MLGGYLMDHLGLANSTTWAEVALKLEGLAPGLVALVAVGSTLGFCCALALLCAVRLRLRRMRTEFEERLRLVQVQKDLNIFDEHGGVPSGLDQGAEGGGIMLTDMASSNGSSTRAGKKRRAAKGTRAFDELEDDDDL